MRKIVAFTLVCFLFALVPSRTLGQAVYNVCSTFSGTDVPITTTAETVVATSEACRMPGRPVKLVVRVYGVMTTSTLSTTYTVRVRRDSVSGTVLGDAIAENVKVTAGQTEAFTFAATDERAGNLNSALYVATIQMAGADATTTVGQAYIEVMVLG